MAGVRPSRPLPYDLSVKDPGGEGALHLAFANAGTAAAVLHAYDRRRLDSPPRRYTLEPGTSLEDHWPDGAYDVCIYGPNGFYRAFSGTGASRPSISVDQGVAQDGEAQLVVRYQGAESAVASALDASYADALLVASEEEAGANRSGSIEVDATSIGGWYDLTLAPETGAQWRVRLAGRVETGAPSTSDPAMGGAAVMKWV